MSTKARLAMWQYWRDPESGRSVLVEFEGERFGVQFDVPTPSKPLPYIRCRKRVSHFAHRHGLRAAIPSAIALELLRQYVNAQSLEIPSPS